MENNIPQGGLHAPVQEISTRKAPIVFRRKRGRWHEASLTRWFRFTLEEAREVARTRSRTAPKATVAAAVPTRATQEVADGPKPAAREIGAASVSDILGHDNRPASTAAKPKNDGVPRKFLRYFKLLLDLREHVAAELELHTRDTLKHSSREDAGDLSGYSLHTADSATDSFDRDFALSLVSTEQEALAEIDSAIRRIHDGTYGVCEVTGRPIEKERLLAVPFTRFSFEGQMNHERHPKMHVRREGAFLDSSYENRASPTGGFEE